MTAASQARSGGRVLVDNLKIHGVERVFCVPGESYLDVLNAFHDTAEIEVVVCRHEGAAAFMAEADGKLTGKPGICFVTRGPGATHASIGVHAAKENSTPMVLFVGQVERGHTDREAFQEIDYRQMFGGMAKWVAQVENAARLPEYVLRAFQTATAGRPGPVVLALPEDMLEDSVIVDDAQAFGRVQNAPTVADLDALRLEIEQSDRPLIVAGGSGWTVEACRQLRAFAESSGLPVVTSFRRQDLFDNSHSHYAGHLAFGNPRLAENVQSADLLVVIGSRLSEVSSQGYTSVKAPLPGQRFVHVHPDPEELGRVYQANVMINCAMPGFASALQSLTPTLKPERAPWRWQLNRDALAFGQPPPPAAEHRGVHLATVVSQIAGMASRNAIVCNGAGNYTLWVHRFHQYSELGTEVAPVGGAMGYGLPAAIAAKLRHPDRTVICFAGDGCFQMYPQELGTAVRYGAAVVVLVVNNGMYGTIRMHQERRYPGRVSNTALVNPDFVALAHSYGAYAERVVNTEDFAAAFSRAQGAGVPALLDLHVDPAQITPTMRLAAAVEVLA